MSKRKKISLTDWLGFRDDIVKESTRPLGAFLGWLISALSLVLIVLVILLLIAITRAALSPDEGADVRNIGLVLAALVGAPFVIWRSAVAAKQASIQDESLFNDKINAAAEDLAARRTVTRRVGEDDKERILSEEEDDLVTRAAAIDRLEGLANERTDAAPRIARMLSIYVRELSKQKGLEPQEHDGLTDENRFKWAHSLRHARSDLEKAAQTLGRLKKIDGLDPEDIPIDLRNANLQGFDLHGLNFDKALMSEARMEGANLSGARMEGAVLRGARMEGADLIGARMEGAVLMGARMEGADLGGARMEGADLSWARMEGADLRGARMEGAGLSGARMEGANLIGARMEGAYLGWARMEGADLRGAADGRGGPQRGAVRFENRPHSGRFPPGRCEVCRPLCGLNF